MDMRSLVRRRMDKLLEALEEAAATARHEAGVEQVHQLRVATRRLSQNLKTFKAFYPGGEVRKIRKKLRGMRDAAAELRSRDIAQEQLKAARLAEGVLGERLRQEREAGAATLRRMLAKWEKKGYPLRWHDQLGAGS